MSPIVLWGQKAELCRASSNVLAMGDDARSSLDVGLRNCLAVEVLILGSRGSLLSHIMSSFGLIQMFVVQPVPELTNLLRSSLHYLFHF